MDFGRELSRARADQQFMTDYVKQSYGAENLVLPAYVQMADVEEKLLPDEEFPEGMENGQKYKHFVHYASRFHLSDEGKLYRREKNSPSRLVVQKEHRMYMMRSDIGEGLPQPRYWSRGFGGRTLKETCGGTSRHVACVRKGN
ncbi:hypothetical protein B0H17DRAFT_1134018 [Mycena rosella]|uniref:Uncharacterized protein n=1 Tax=Mycena rosella TaxID=1033263 RepID=A0AAD7DG93_MYCRO|nr:hypothetical protein B0H17DRAFT_1134018 [Mycena rosella]